MTLRLGYFPNVTHAPAIVGVEEGLFADALGDDVDARVVDVQRRHRGHRGAVRRGHRRHASSAPTRPSTASPSPTARRCASSSGTTSGGASLVVREGIDARRGPRGHQAGHAVARQHPGRGAAGVAGRAGLRDRHQPAAATSRSAPGERRHARPPSRPATSTAPGCPSRGPPASSRRAAARCSSTRPTCGPTASSSPPTSSWAPSSSTSTPTSSAACSRAWSTPSTSSTADPEAAQAVANDGIEAHHHQAASPTRRIDGAWENLDVHLRPDRLVAAEVRGRRRRGRAARAGRPRRHLRPDAAQRGPGRARTRGGGED